MRATYLFLAFPFAFAAFLYFGAIAPATAVIERIGASVAAPTGAHSAPCYSDSAAKHFGISPRANALNCAAQR